MISQSAQASRRLHPTVVVLSSLLGFLFGPFLAALFSLLIMVLALYLFSADTLLGGAFVFYGVQLGSLAGWIVGGYGPSALALTLPADQRRMHFVASFAIVSVYGLILLGCGALAFSLRPQIAYGILGLIIDPFVP